MKRHKKLLAGIALFVAIAVVGTYVVFRQSSYEGYFCAPGPSCKNRSYKYVEDPTYKVASSYYVSGTGGYECSKPIKLVSHTVDKNGKAVEFVPVDAAEGNLFCQLTVAEEYKGKLKVLHKPEVLALIAKYPYKDVSIKALEFKYIQDKDYVHRLLPDFKDKEIGCIILLDTPGEDKVYLEDEQLETFQELDYQTFAGYLGKVSPADRQLFYDNLK